MHAVYVSGEVLGGTSCGCAGDRGMLRNYVTLSGVPFLKYINQSKREV